MDDARFSDHDIPRSDQLRELVNNIVGLRVRFVEKHFASMRGLNFHAAFDLSTLPPQTFGLLQGCVRAEALELYSKQIYAKEEIEDRKTAFPAILNRAILDMAGSFCADQQACAGRLLEWEELLRAIWTEAQALPSEMVREVCIDDGRFAHAIPKEGQLQTLLDKIAQFRVQFVESLDKDGMNELTQALDLSDFPPLPSAPPSDDVTG